MGRAFEFRRARKEKRWDWMAKTFTKIGKEISIAVKQGGSDPENNPRLRTLIQNAKTNNMPKDRVESAIKRAASKDDKGYEEVIYEGYGPYGVAILVETATDNPTRTVANIRMYFNRGGGTLGKTGSLDFIFTRKGVFKIDAAGIDKDELELEMIDFGVEEIFADEDGIVMYAPFESFGAIQKELENRSIEILSSGFERIPQVTKELSPEQVADVEKLLEKIEEDDDVMNVYHTMQE